MSDVTRRMAKRPPVSEAQVKATPSKAVNDLVDSLFEDLPEDDVQETYWKSRCADLIQSHQPLRDLLEKAGRADTLLRECPPTVRQVITAGDKAISAAGLNPWCINEGRATGDETIHLDLADALEPWKPK